MTEPASGHGTFSLQVRLGRPVDVVLHAVLIGAQRRLWLRLPGRQGPEPAVDYEAGTHETLTSTIPIGDREEHVRRRTHVVEAGDAGRVVLVYEAVVDGTLRWASLVSVQLASDGADATSLTWTEQYVLVRPSDDAAADVSHLVGGTRMQLTALALALGLQPGPADLTTYPSP